MSRFLTIAMISYGELIRRLEVIIVSAIGLLFVTGMSIVLLDDEFAAQVAAGVERSQGFKMEITGLVEGSIVYAEIFAILVTILISMNLTGREIKSNVISQYLVKPISRNLYLASKVFGGMMVSITVYAIYILLIGFTLLVRDRLDFLPFASVILSGTFKFILLYSMVLMFSQKMPGFPAALLGTIIYIGGYYADLLYLMSISFEFPLKPMVLSVYYILPHLIAVSPGSLIDSREEMLHVFKWISIYGIAYSGIWFYFATRGFNKREF